AIVGTRDDITHVNAAATPSAASDGVGTDLSRSSRVSMNCTCVLVAAPFPTTVFFISAGGYSMIGMPACEKNDAPGMAEYDGRANVVRVEHVFDGQRIRAMRADELADAVIYLLQTHRERLARSGADDTTLDE